MRTTSSVLLLAALSACGGSASAPVDERSPVDTSVPVALDAAAVDADAPDTYKGLVLSLVDNGRPTVTAVDGVIGVVCVGMSNANQECQDFQERVAGEYAGEISPALRVVNCAVGAHAVEKWIDPAYDGVLWERCVQRRLPEAGVRLDQVRVIWHKAANQFTTLPDGGAKPTYPQEGSDYEAFLLHLTAFAERVHGFFPAVQAVYSSSRSYGGYASNQARRGEPLSYEEGHALNTWLAAHRYVDGVWYGWGPYLWAPACSTGATNGSGVCYERADYMSDGVHPAEGARAKVSRMLHQRFLQEGWYRR